jgi:competence protein ComEA
MADEEPPLGVRAGPLPAKGPPPPIAVTEPPLWPPLAQWCMAGLIALALVLVGWRGWGLSRYSARPMPLERAAARQTEVAPAYEEAPPRLVRAKAEEPVPRGKKKPPETPLDINRASAGELMQLPGVGPTLSARIVAARPFASVDDLRRVKGIGPKTLEGLRPHVVAGKPPRP